MEVQPNQKGTEMDLYDALGCEFFGIVMGVLLTLYFVYDKKRNDKEKEIRERHEAKKAEWEKDWY